MAATIHSPQTQEHIDPLKAALGRHIFLRWQTLVFVAIFIAAVFTRFYGLGDRAMSHDESLHVYYSYNLYMKGDFDHTPLMHGPIMFHVNALMYALFGDNDFTGRLYAALLGIAMVMSPLLFKRWLGKWGTILASLMVLISPLLMYYNRYIREDTPAIMASILMAWAALTYISGDPEERRKPRYLYILSAALLWNLGSKETAFFYVAIFGLFLTLYWLFRMVQVRWKISGRQWFSGMMMGVLFGGVLALAMYTIHGIAPLKSLTETVDPDPIAQQLMVRSLLVWSVAAVVVVFIGMTGTLLWAFRKRLNRVPWLEFAMIAVLTLAVTAAFIVIEQRSYLSHEDVGLLQTPADPTIVEPSEVVTGNISWAMVLMPWLLMVGAMVLFYISRRKNAEGKDWWDWLYQFPELDVLWIMGTLILPWITAIFIVGARGSPESYAQIGQNLDRLSAILPTGNNDPTSIGKFFVGFLCWLPLFVTSFVAGITWNWRRFIVCWLIFHAIFAFFFTTVFTNIQGFATGMIYSLQYWLEQQAERRGGQPQYYYTLIILPMYEFLPIIGTTLAALGGSFIFWKRRARVYELEAESAANRKHKHLLAAQAAMVDASGDNPPQELVEGSEGASAIVLPGNIEEIEAREEKVQRELHGLNTLAEVPFLLFVSFWAILNVVVFTLAGEKMPWLGTHMTTPMILITAWYFGRIFDRLDVVKLLKSGWIQLILYPLMLVSIFQMLTLQLTGQGPFQGTQQFQLQYTYGWLAALVVGVVIVFILISLQKQTGQKHGRQLFAVSVFAVLSLVTFRSAWMASFINYDYANEFLVYAHATPGTKIVMNVIDDLSKRTTDGNFIKFAYDNKLSWPGAWYFRHYPNATFMGDTPSLPMMDDAMVILVGEGNVNVVEPLLEDRYQRFDFKRMWWPMQEYFYLTPARVIDLFAFEDQPTGMVVGDYPSAQMRHGLWDIFWFRDYTKYGQAIGRSFAFNEWPVSENMYMYVRKDFAVEVWEYGIGDGSVTNPIAQTEVSACVANWQQPSASLVYDLSAVNGRLLSPTGLDVTDDGRVLVAEASGFRISEFTTDGAYIRSFGQQGGPDNAGTFFERPHSVQVAPNGSIVVVDTWNHRIRVFNPALEQIAVWGRSETAGNGARQDPVDGFWGPRDVVIGPDNLVYISDTGNKRIRVYTLSGLWVRDIGQGGPGPGQLNEPAGVAIHSDGRVFIADTWNRRIAVFAADGTFIVNYPVRAWYEEYGNRPYIAIDEARDILYVTDPDGGRVLVYNTQGECLGAFGQLSKETAPNDSEFNTIGGIDVDADGNIYIADLGTGRLLKFAPFPLPEPVVIDPVEDMLGDLPEGSMAIPFNILPETSPETEPQG